MSVLSLCVIALLVGFLLPSQFHVQRQIKIAAPPETVFAHIANLRAWRKWGVWFQRDPNMNVTYSGPEAAVGMQSVWQSEQEGSGQMTITALKLNEKIVYDLAFPELGMGSTGELTLSAQDGVTTVVWADYGDVGDNPLYRYFALLMDGMIGPDFEAGLENLKSLVES